MEILYNVQMLAPAAHWKHSDVPGAFEWRETHEENSLGQRHTKIKQVTRMQKDFGIAVTRFLNGCCL